jgi:hypothetical protein
MFKVKNEVVGWPSVVSGDLAFKVLTKKFVKASSSEFQNFSSQISHTVLYETI